jgi:hypothetical protein
MANTLALKKNASFTQENEKHELSLKIVGFIPKTTC